MNIQVSDLKKFQKYSKNILSSRLLSINNYIKFGNGTITKSVFSSFVQFDCVDAKEELLVDEHLLFSLLNTTVSDFINISSKGNKVTISDTRDKLVFQTPKVEEFPAIPDLIGDKISISTEFIEGVGMASNFPLPMGDIPEKYMYVHIGGNTICAGDGIVGFHMPIEEKVTIVVEKKIAQLLSRYNLSSFAESETYYFFWTPDAIIGFAKQAIGWMDIRHFFASKGDRTFTASASDIKSFNALSMQASATCVVTMSTGLFEMNDMLTDINYTRPSDNLKLPEPFTFNPGRMNTLIEALGTDKLDFHEIKGGYFIKSPDTKATAIIAKIAKS